MRKTLIITLLILTIGLSLAQQSVYCPSISCVTYDDDMEADNICMWNTGDIPTTSVKLRSCNDNPNQICDLLNYDSFAWPNVSIQFNTNTSIKDPSLSPYYKKQTKVQCKDRTDLIETGLLNGRKCLEDYQCLSRQCEWNTGFCKGKVINQTCNDHSDCDNGLACFANSTWPYTTVCKAQLSENATCTSDYECKNNMGCVKVNNDTQYKCAKYYSLGDSTLFYLLNATTYYNVYNITKDAIYDAGKYCKSGLANRFFADRAQCVNIDYVRVSTDVNNTVASPYACRADGKVTCSYYQNNIATVRFQLLCECGFDQTTGYCPIPNQRLMNTSATTMNKMLSYSNCHTYDRFNLVAQRECGMPYVDINQTDYYESVVDRQFQIKYWTFTRTQTAYDCMNGIFPISAASVMAFGTNIQYSLIMGFISVLGLFMIQN